MNKKLDKLKNFIAQLTDSGLCVAFSGGVDSALLLKICCQLSDNVHAVTFDTSLHPKSDAQNAKRIAKEYGSKHCIIEIDEFSNEDIMKNPVNRCYVCKKMLFTELKNYALENNLNVIIDGTNADDLLEYRPGIKALRELSIISPLAHLGISKKDVREMATELGLDVAKKPSAPCLATRLPYNTVITKESLEKIQSAEKYLKSLGFETVRLRLHNDIARIEVPKSSFVQLINLHETICTELKKLGFIYITMDLEGFRSGSMDINIKGEK